MEEYFKMSVVVARAGRSHTASQNLIKPVTETMNKLELGGTALKSV
jgi:hypothetical protein